MDSLYKIVNSLQKELARLEKREKQGVSYKTEKRLIKNAISKLMGRNDIKLSKRG